MSDAPELVADDQDDTDLYGDFTDDDESETDDE